MKNTEKDYRDAVIAGGSSVEKTNQDYNNKKPNPADPNEVKGKPEISLPLISKFEKSKTGKTVKEDELKEAEGNNYTAAENDNGANSTL